ncbi:hypothetical protein [Streptomyces sp. NPDC018000]|uniref:hypothetical protein n=1 Tax=Streptomyces sp. NPDC018000 TaxID=3365028 RepID=UPI0037A28BB2
MKRRAAVIGLGHQAIEDHLPGLLASSRAELVAICDSNSDTLRQRQEQLQVLVGPAGSGLARQMTPARG